MTRCWTRPLALLTLSALLCRGLAGHAQAKPVLLGQRVAPARTNGPVLVLDARGGMGHPAPGDAHILVVHGSRVVRVLAGGLPFPFSGAIAPSPQGREVAYGADLARTAVTPPRAHGLWLAPITGGPPRRLLVSPRSTQQNQLGIGPVAWSPDGATLAYAVVIAVGVVVNSQQERALGLWLTPSHQAHPRELLTAAQLGVAEQGAATVTRLAWSPDGHTLIVSTFCDGAAGPAPCVLGVELSTSRVRTLVRGGQDADVSPVTGALAYTTGTGHGTTLWVTAARGGRPRALARGMPSGPVWSPDGHALAFIDVTDGSVTTPMTTILRTVTVATGQSHTILRADQRGQALLPAGGRFVGLAWMAAGAAPISRTDRLRIGTVGMPPRTAPLLPLVLQSHLYVVSSSGGPLRRLTAMGLQAGPPQLSPDGRMIAYLATSRRLLDRYGNVTANDVWVVPVTGHAGGTSAHQITTTQPHLLRAQISWSPDSTRIAYDEGHSVVVADIASAAQRAVLQVAAPPGGAALSLPIAWSPDGRQIAVAYLLGASGPAAYPTALRILSVPVTRGQAHTSTVRFPPGALGHAVPPGSYPASSVVWLPNGRGFVVQTQAKGAGPSTPTGVWTVPASGGVAHLFVGTPAGVKGGGYPAGTPLDQATRALFSPDRTRLATDPAGRLWLADAGGQHGYFLSLGLGRGCTLTQVTWLTTSAGLAYVAVCVAPGSIQVQANLFTVDARRGAIPRRLYVLTGTDQTDLVIAPISRCVLCGY